MGPDNYFSFWPFYAASVAQKDQRTAEIGMKELSVGAEQVVPSFYAPITPVVQIGGDM